MRGKLVEGVLLEIAEHVEGYQSFTDQQLAAVREVAAEAGGDWPARVVSLLAAVGERRPGAKREFLGLATAFSARQIEREAIVEAVAETVRNAIAEAAQGDREPVEASGRFCRREFSWRASIVDATAGTVSATIATESPVPMFDPIRREMVPEILLASGANLPPQVPLLDSHSRGSMKDQLGSVRQIRTSGSEVAGTLAFASHESAQHAFSLVSEGHADSVSAGYVIHAVKYVPAEKSATFGGRTITGPANVVTKWTLREVSLVILGRDEGAKVR